jgi:hypothetical protein
VSRIARNASFALLLSYALAGCVSTKTVPVDRGVLAGFHGATVVTSQRGKPAFAANTAGKAMLGAIGGIAAVTSGNAIIRDNDVPDPAVQIKDVLLSDLLRDEGLRKIDNSATTDTMNVAQIAKQYSNADLVLDIQTVNWSFWYFPTDFSHYRVIYSAKLRLIDTKHARLIADGFCARAPEKTPDAPTRAELLDDHAAGLKKQLAIAADYCANEFRTKALLESAVAAR